MHDGVSDFKMDQGHGNLLLDVSGFMTINGNFSLLNSFALITLLQPTTRGDDRGTQAGQARSL